MKVFLVLLNIAVSISANVNSSLLIDIIHESFPDEIRVQLVHELQHHGSNFDLSKELHDKISKHVTLVKSQLPTLEAINNFLSNFPDNKQSEASDIIQEALLQGITESEPTTPAESSNQRQLISPKRLQQILPDRLQRDILEELFLKGGLEHMSPELRRKVHDEMQRVRESFVLPPAAKVEQFLQHFPPELREELRQFLERTRVEGRLPEANEALREKVAEFMDAPNYFKTRKRTSGLSADEFNCFLDLLPYSIREGLLAASEDVHIVPEGVDKIKRTPKLDKQG